MKRVLAAAIPLAALIWWVASSLPPTGFLERRAANRQLKILEAILRSRNDNDPLLDRAFVGLSPMAKDLFRKKYAETPPERRNERGTIVYVLGRNLRSPEDWAFLRAVAAEPPCLSLADCAAKSTSGGHELGDEVTLAYPSLVALKQAERALEKMTETDP